MPPARAKNARLPHSPGVNTGLTAAVPGAITIQAISPSGAKPSGLAPATPSAAPIPLPGLATTGSEIYRIAPDGSPKRIWGSREDLVYALTFDRNRRLIAGTGNKGKIYAIEGNGEFADLLKASANQVTGFAPAPNGGIYTACSNLGKVFLMEDSSQREGTYDSDVFDARIFSRWGRVEMHGQGLVDLYARSGNVDNPDRNWSPWSKINLKAGAETQIPPARYAQWRAVLHSGPMAPRVNSVRLYYLPKNVAPEVDDVTVQMARPASAPHPEAGNPNPSVRRIASGAQRHYGALDGTRRQRRSVAFLHLLPRRWRQALAAAERRPQRALLCFRSEPDSRRRIHHPRGRLRCAFARARRGAHRLEG